MECNGQGKHCWLARWRTSADLYIEHSLQAILEDEKLRIVSTDADKEDEDKEDKVDEESPKKGTLWMEAFLDSI